MTEWTVAIDYPVYTTHSVGRTRVEAILLFFGVEHVGMKGWKERYAKEWRWHYRRGYRCIKVEP